MPHVVIHKNGESYSGDIAEGTNLVVLAGVRKFPFPHLRYGCGMGKCGKCACRVLDGQENLPAPNWKENERLGEHLKEGYRLVCQLWLTHDIELFQDNAVLPPNRGSVERARSPGGSADVPHPDQ